VLRLSTWLLVASALVPEIGGALVCAILRGYQRRLTRFTPSCPQSPSCSAFTLGAVESLGPRHGLAAAARRIQSCGPVHGGSMSELASESSTQRSREAATERSEGVR
jgi:putative component of membrane protein insertase Oxa1/YidC/SpoIIIJ protein YidD